MHNFDTNTHYGKQEGSGRSTDEPRYDLTRARKTTATTAQVVTKAAILAQVHRPASSNSSVSRSSQNQEAKFIE
jgi:hypothetical protein